MKKILFICNTPYQVFTATWLKITEFFKDDVDIVVSDHMSKSEKLFENIKHAHLFGNVYYVKTKEYRDMPGSSQNKWVMLFHPCKILKKYINIKKKYDILCVANLDRFTKLCFCAVANDRFYKYFNRNLKIYLYEDGTSTYSKYIENGYNSCKLTGKHKQFFKNRRVIYGNLEKVYVYEPRCMLWKPEAKVKKIKSVDSQNETFKNVINLIFEYEKMSDIYDRKYIFMEESFFADKVEIDDVSLLESFAKIVGKDNIMVKIHPRNAVNRFEDLGYKTNKDTFIPWELIILNQDISSKVLLTISSTSILNPIRLFGINVRAYSLYKCVDNIPNVLSNGLWEAIEYAYEQYSPFIKILNNKRELKTIK